MLFSHDSCLETQTDLTLVGDSTLEVAMEMLCVVGLGPKNYAARRGEKACFLFRAKPDGEWRTGFEGPPGATDIGETGKAAIDAIRTLAYGRAGAPYISDWLERPVVGLSSTFEFEFFRPKFL